MQQAICEKMGVPVKWQTLVKGDQKLPAEVQCGKCAEIMRELLGILTSDCKCAADGCDQDVRFGCTAKDCDYQLCQQHSEEYQATVGSLLSEEVPDSLQLTLLVQKRCFGPINFVGMCNGLEHPEPGRLLKTEGAEALWNAMAVSTEPLIVGQDRGFRFRPLHKNTLFRIGLGSQKTIPEDMTYGVTCDDSFVLTHDTSTRRAFHPHFEGTAVEIRVTQTSVVFYVDWSLLHTAALNGESTLYVLAAFHHAGAEAVEIEWL